MSDERNDKIRAGIRKLDTTEDGHWTLAGLPSVDKVRELSGVEDATREEISKQAPNYHRANADAAPSDLKNVGGGGDAGPTESDELKNNELTGSSADGEPALNSSDSTHYLQANALAEKINREYEDPAEIASHIKNPIVLIEAAFAAMNADDRYRKNGELQNFMRGYLVSQPNIKAHQARLDDRYKRIEDAENAAG